MAYVNHERSQEIRRHWLEVPGVIETKLTDYGWVVKFDPEISSETRETGEAKVLKIAQNYGGFLVNFE